MNSIVHPKRIDPRHAAAEASSDDHRDLGFSLPPPARLRRTRVVAFALTMVAIAAGAFAFAYLPRRAERLALAQSAKQASQARRRVTVVTPKLVSEGHRVRLSGSIQPLEETAISARATGYVRRWLADMGAHVEARALLAEIDTPEIDQELSSARAALAQAEAKRVQATATERLSQSTFARTQKLVKAGVAAQQELESTEAQSQVGVADVTVAEAEVAARKANIRRLQELKSFSRITAPFAGTITARNVERGNLVTAGSSSPLFRLAATDTVRIFVRVPQSVATGVKAGLRTQVRIREFPGLEFEGEVARTSGALDPTSRTLNAEIHVPNRDGKLLSGMYAEVDLALVSPHRVVELPSTTLMSDAMGLRMAVVGDDGKLEMRRVTLERDLGPTVQVASGLAGNERVVQIASAELTEGERVDVVP